MQVAKKRWRVERDYQDLKQEFGLGHFEGRGWRGFHYHATRCIAAYGFLVARRLIQEGSKKTLKLAPTDLTPGLRISWLPSARSATWLTPSRRAAYIARRLHQCPFCSASLVTLLIQ
nr:transposase [Burkholderia oklahomensis]